MFSKLNHPESLNVVANLVNSPETGWLHYRMGAVHAYLPEYEPPAPDDSGASYGPKAWRASALPQWRDVFTLTDSISQEANNGQDMMGSSPASPPFHGHRWLPLPKGEENLYRTPISQSQYNAFGHDWRSWAIAAQVHYSLLENIENNQLSRYYYGNGIDDTREGIWNMAYERMNINVMAIWGKDVLENLPFQGKDDEKELSVTIPRKLRRRKFCSIRKFQSSSSSIQQKKSKLISKKKKKNSSSSKHPRHCRSLELQPPATSLRDRPVEPVSSLRQRNDLRSR